MSSVTRTVIHPVAGETCPDCGGRVRDNCHEAICAECGLVVKTDAIRHDFYPGTIFDEDGKAGTCHHEKTWPHNHDGGLGTEVKAYRWRRAGKSARLARAMETYHSRAKAPTKTRRNRRDAFSQIERAGAAIGCPIRVRARATRLFAAAQDAGCLIGHSIEAFVGGALLQATREATLPVTVADVHTAVQVADRRPITQAALAVADAADAPALPPEPHVFIERACTALDVSHATRREARALCTEAEAAGVHVAKHPFGVAAACVYAVAPVTQSEAAAAGQTTDVTIRDHVDAFREAGLVEYDGKTAADLMVTVDLGGSDE